MTEAEGQAFATKHGLLFMEMSARNSAQVEQAFIGTAERVSKYSMGQIMKITPLDNTCCQRFRKRFALV